MHRRILLRIGLPAESVRSPAFAASRCLALTKDTTIANWRGPGRILYRRSSRTLYNLKTSKVHTAEAVRFVTVLRCVGHRT